MSQLKWNERFFTSALQEVPQELKDRACKSIRQLKEGTFQPEELCGWYDYPKKKGFSEVQEILNFVAQSSEIYDLVVVIGVGGSYLGTRAVYEALSHEYSLSLEDKIDDLRLCPIVFTGHHLSETSLLELFDLLDHYHPIVNVVSKSGMTTEPGVAFRVIFDYLRKRYGKEARNRLIITTDKVSGSLRKIAEQENIPSFAIPGNIGGRYSVLTPVGMLPLALAKVDITAIQQGAQHMFDLIGKEDMPVVASYAANRIFAYQEGKKIEVLAYHEPKLKFFAEWWRQLFGESEGKGHQGIFPTTSLYTTDLHSMGQYMQEGERILFETFLHVKDLRKSIEKAYDRRLLVPAQEALEDDLNYLEARRVRDLNEAALDATAVAHFEGGVPNQAIIIDVLDEYALGLLFAFFQTASAVSASLMGVNPFNQPGVEKYKQNLFASLGKPGFENEGKTALPEEFGFENEGKTALPEESGFENEGKTALPEESGKIFED